MDITINVTGALEAQRAIEKIRTEDLPLLLRRICWSTATQIQSHSLRTAGGEVLKRYGRQSGLTQHIRTQKPVIEDGGRAVSWGLPRGNLVSRIGAFMEEGGTITPKNTKMLRIPIKGGPADMATGDPFYQVPLRHHPEHGFFVRLSKKGNPVLSRVKWSRKGDKGTVETWYALVSKATIRPHPWFATAIDRAKRDLPSIVKDKLAVMDAEVKARGAR